MKLSLIRVTKRVLVSVAELSVLAFLPALSYMVGVLVADANGCYISGACWPGAVVVVAGWLLSIVGFVALRRITRPWGIEYDAVGWTLARTERTLHPARAKYRRITQRIIIWVPALIAAVVLFFFPMVSHLPHLRSRYVRHYRIPVPWSFTVFSHQDRSLDDSWLMAIGSSDGFGATPFPQSEQSLMMFGSIRPDADTFKLRFQLGGVRRRHGTQVFIREFRLGDATFICQQYVPRDSRHFGSWPYWKVDCTTPPEMRARNLYATFDGPKEDIPAFYKIIENITPAE